MADPTVLAALIGAVAPTLAAGAAWRAVVKSRREFAVTNGHKPGFMIERTYEMLLDHVTTPASKAHPPEK